MKNKLPLLALLFSCFSLLSCERERGEPAPAPLTEAKFVDVKNGRITFSDDDAFSSIMEETMAKKDPRLTLKVLNISESIKKNTFSPLLRSSSSTIANGKTVEQDDAVIDEDDLIPDPYFASLFNENREIQIGENIVKITNQGTYICHFTKYDRLIEILKGNPEHGNDGAGDSKELEAGIFFYDSFAAEETTEKIDFSTTTFEGGTNARTNAVTRNYLDQAIYNSFDTHSFGSHTVVGGWIESALGRREVQYVYFNNKERLKLNFYNVNYVVFSSIGINTQLQHKTWIGWNGTLHGDEIRMGWEGLMLEFPFALAPSPGIPSVTFEKLKLGDIGIDIASYNFVSDQLNAFATDQLVKDIAKVIDGQIQEQFSSTLKKSYDLVYKNVAPQQWNFYKNYTDQFRLIFPNKFTQVLGRHEEVEYNAHKISKNFDWSTARFGFSTNGTTPVSIDNFGLAGTATNFKILKASVYAGAKRGNVWKGVRIIKQ